MSTGTIEAVYEAEDELTPREREIEAYHAATQHLDRDDIHMAACGVLSCQEIPAMLDLITVELREPYDDVSRAIIHPDMAQAIARAYLEAVAVSIDGQAAMIAAVEGSSC